ncbi:DUF3581 domain-containing protein [Spiribacter halobius]|uniref:DUF3581 domain-containing protein n=1 Tax=Sediminicurvatus halobius TaxID=2182432 RepID=A0A2U2N8W6_9GAMM|nr:DUF3581 domain-containing protein [Spiribacter halobius]
MLAPYHDQRGGQVVISALQGSRFAKEVAGDHNPIHDADAPRFCVPGDLLFGLILQRYGLCRQLNLAFRGMLRGDTPLRFPAAAEDRLAVIDAGGRPVVDVVREGALPASPAAIAAVIRGYVAFSGRSFPELLHPLLAAEGVMFNTERPLVVYDSMRLRLDETPSAEARLTLTDSHLSVAGRRGDAQLTFAIHEGERRLGEGAKNLVVSGLRPYDAEAMERMVAAFERRQRQR